MANPGRDVYNVVVDDVRSEERQREIEGVVEGLLRFRPTKVAVEHANEVNVEYRHYLAGDLELSRDETHQLGFRIAARSGHHRLYPINVMVDVDANPWEWAPRHGQAAMMDEINAGWHAIMESFEETLRTGTIRDVLRLVNGPERLRREQMLYLALVQIGRGDEYLGADWLAGWYERNLKIFANLVRITEPDDRIFVLYGSGHVPLLGQFMRESDLYELEEIGTYLGAT
jgi:hypothetical protein